MNEEERLIMSREMFTSIISGQEVSRAQYIRELFTEKNMSRDAIAKELGVAYHTVYSATNNLFNEVHTAEKSGGITSVPVARVNSNFEFVNAEGEVVETAEEAAKVMRVDLVKELFQAGVARPKLAEFFGVTYATIYSATKDIKNGNVSGGKKTVVHPETGETINRVDYIRELFANGKTRKEIATELTIMTGELVDYAVVWAATKEKKEAVESTEAPVEKDLLEAADVEEDFEEIE